jgi:peptidoglycan hydrolase-like protein with peptidoglycan-binding domain
MSTREVQERLNALGYDVGTPDGSAGPRTAKALREFQQAQGIPVTGRVDAATTGALSR